MEKRTYLKAYLLTMIFAGIGYGQTGQYFVCQEKQAWFVNDAKVIKLGECNYKLWIVSLEITLTDNVDKLSERQKELVIWFKLLQLGKVRELELSKTGLRKILKNNSKIEKINLALNKFPTRLQDLMFPANSMMVIVTYGFSIGYDYREKGRFTIKVKGNNPLIEDILEEYKKEERKLLMGTKDEWLLNYQPSYYLETADMKQKLDPTKTAADHKLKNGDILRVFSGSR